MSASFSSRALRVFETGFRPWMRSRIRGPLAAGLPTGLAADLPMLMVANHVSWWDGFVLREVQRLLRPDAPIYTVMLERELRRHPFFRRVGAVGIDPSSTASLRGALRSLQLRLCARSDSVVLFFPQGTIRPAWQRPLGFQRGVELFARALAPLTVLPVALHQEPLNAVRPTFFAVVGDPIRGEVGHRVDAGELERKVTGALDRIQKHIARFGERAVAEWPPRDVAPAVFGSVTAADGTGR